MSEFAFRLTDQKDTSNSILLTDDEVPMGWDSRRPSIERDTLYHGAFTSFTAALTFVFSGFVWIESIYSNYGILASVLIEFLEKDNQTKQWSVQDTGVIDFKTRNIVSTVRGGGVEYDILDTGFKQKVRNREDTDISYIKEESLDGDVISEPRFKYTEVLGVQVADSDIYCNMFKLKYTGSTSQRNIVYGINPATTNNLLQSVESRLFEGGDLPELVTELDCFYLSSQHSVVKLDWNIDYNIASDDSHESIENRFRLYKVFFNNSPVTVEEISGQAYFRTGTFNFSGDEEIILEQNEGLYFYGFQLATNFLGSVVDVQSIITDSDINLSYVETFAKNNAITTFPYEIFQRLKESITGDTSPIDAPILNRPDTINPSEEYGKYSKYAIANGLLMRGFTTEESNLSFNLKDFYTQFDNIFNIGLDFNGDNFTIKEKKDFYTQDLVHSFGKESVVEDSISKKFALDYFYCDVTVGYVARSNENVGGLQEYLSNASYNTALNVLNNTLELTSELIANAYTIEEIRRLQKLTADGVNNETTDSSFDQDLIILDTVPYTGYTGYKQRTTEDIENISGLPLITTPMNLSITPGRNIDRWGWMLLTGLQKYASTPISHNTSEIKQNTEDGEVLNVSSTIDGKTIIENTDLPFNKFDPAIFGGMLIEVDVIANLDIFKAIKTNPYGLIGVYNEVEEQMNYGWLMSLSLGATDKDTTMTLIEAKSVSFILKSWLWESGEKILWESGEFIALED